MLVKAHCSTLFLIFLLAVSACAPRFYATTASSGSSATDYTVYGYFWTFGGWNGAAPVNTVTQSTDSGLNWSSVGTIPTALSDMAACRHRGKIYLMGGFDGVGAVDTVISSSDGLTWSAEPSLPAIRQNGGCYTYGGRLYYVGGNIDNTNGTAQSSIFSWDVGEAAWTIELTILPSALTYFSVNKLGDTVFLIGGYGAGAVLQQDIYQATDGKTFNLAALFPVALAYQSATQANGMLYLADSQNQNFYYSTDGLNWSVVNAILGLSIWSGNLFANSTRVVHVGGCDPPAAIPCRDTIDYSNAPLSPTAWAVSGTVHSATVGFAGYIEF